MKKVLVAGTFDIIHPGHLSFLNQAKKRGDFLIVIVARDKTVEKIKKHTPKRNEKTRVKNLQQLKITDKVILGDLVDHYKVIETIKPDFICLGYDQKAFTKNLKREIKLLGLQPKIIRLKAYQPKKYKSSLMNP